MRSFFRRPSTFVLLAALFGAFIALVPLLSGLSDGKTWDDWTLTAAGQTAAHALGAPFTPDPSRLWRPLGSVSLALQSDASPVALRCFNFFLVATAALLAGLACAQAFSLARSCWGMKSEPLDADAWGAGASEEAIAQVEAASRDSDAALSAHAAIESLRRERSASARAPMWVAFLAALFFGLHSASQEAALWISARFDSLAWIFAWAVLLLAVSVISRHHEKAAAWARGAGALNASSFAPPAWSEAAWPGNVDATPTPLGFSSDAPDAPCESDPMALPAPALDPQTSYLPPTEINPWLPGLLMFGLSLAGFLSKETFALGALALFGILWVSRAPRRWWVSFFAAFGMAFVAKSLLIALVLEPSTPVAANWAHFTGAAARTLANQTLSLFNLSPEASPVWIDGPSLAGADKIIGGEAFYARQLWALGFFASTGLGFFFVAASGFFRELKARRASRRLRALRQQDGSIGQFNAHGAPIGAAPLPRSGLPSRDLAPEIARERERMRAESLLAETVASLSGESIHAPTHFWRESLAALAGLAALCAIAAAPFAWPYGSMVDGAARHNGWALLCFMPLAASLAARCRPSAWLWASIAGLVLVFGLLQSNAQLAWRANEAIFWQAILTQHPSSAYASLNGSRAQIRSGDSRMGPQILARALTYPQTPEQRCILSQVREHALTETGQPRESLAFIESLGPFAHCGPQMAHDKIELLIRAGREPEALAWAQARVDAARARGGSAEPYALDLALAKIANGQPADAELRAVVGEEGANFAALEAQARALKAQPLSDGLPPAPAGVSPLSSGAGAALSSPIQARSPAAQP